MEEARSPPNSSTTGGGSGSGKTYPVLNVVWDAPDYMDPALYYTVAAYQIDNYVWTGLVGYKHTSGPASAELVPYLAESMPDISADGKVYTFTLRDGLKYSDGTAVKASDFQYSIERDFKMDSPGVGFYSDIEGVSGDNGYATTKKGHISGIKVDDATRKITITLDAAACRLPRTSWHWSSRTSFRAGRLPVTSRHIRFRQPGRT